MVSVTVPVVLLVLVEVVEPSGFFTDVVVLLEEPLPEDEPLLEEEFPLEDDPPPVEGMDSRAVS